MKQFFITVAGVVVGSILVSILGWVLLFGLIGAASAPAPQPGRMVLAIDLREPMMDQHPTNPFAA
ncbi:MAG: hypothetical protein K2X34_12825, partial [Hyphomonadaceae bacterium]|nr:hypothetical protein [Hyphomonadaceae bacterium]